MPDEGACTSRLKPLNIQEKIILSKLALNFFSPMAYRDNCKLIERVPAEGGGFEALSVLDFVKYIAKSQQVIDANRSIFLIRDLLSQLAHVHILTESGSRGYPLFGNCYYYFPVLTKREREGCLWLAQALGPEFLLLFYSSVTLQLTGHMTSGEVHTGTGIAIAPHWILTCAHVVKGMILDPKQSFGGREFKVVRQLSHDKVDVALVEVDGDLPRLPGLVFRDPVVTETVYLLGYPPVPLSPEPALVMQRGEITSSRIITYSDGEVFLYSAIARPGNSGGPVISASGHVVGLVTGALSKEASKLEMPFYAGVRTSELSKAIPELETSVQLPVETYE